MANAKIMIVEDDCAVAKDIEEKLETLGYTVLPTVSSGVQAIAKTAEMRPDLILIDIGLEGKMDGIDVASEIHNRFNIPVVYLTDYVNDDLLEKVRTTRAFGHIFKPYGIEQLHLSIENHIYWYEEDQKYREGEQWFSTVLSNVGDGVIATDKDGFVTFMNPTAESMTGWQLEAAAKMDIKQIFRIDAGEDCPITVALTHTLHTDTASESSTVPKGNHNTILTAKSGRKIHIDYNAVPSNNVEGKPIGIVITFRDSTEYKAIEAELNQTIDRLQSQTQLMEAVFDSMCDGMIAVDTDGQYLMVNPKAQETTGGFPTYAPIDERPERYGLFYPDGKTLFSGDELPLTRAIHGEATDNIEMFVCNDDQPDGAFINVNGRPLRDKQGTLKGGVIVFHDHTELRTVQAELEQTVDELRTQTQLMETVFDSMADGVIVTDTDSNLLFSNQKAAQVFNLEIMAPDLLPSAWAERGGLFEADKETYLSTDRNPLLQAVRGETTDDVEVFVRNRFSPDGIHLNVNGRPLLNTDNEVTGGVVIFRDTTKDKAAADQLEQTVDELRTQTQLMETVFNGISDGLVVVSSTGEILISNPSIRQMFNMDGVDASPSEWSETYGIFYPDKETHVPADQLPLFRAMRGEEIHEKEFFIHNENKGFGSYVSASATPLRSIDNQEIIGSVGIVRDITRRKEAEIELKQTLQEQQEQTRLMDTVFNSMNEGLIVSSAEGQVLFTNPSVRQMFGVIETPDLPISEWSKECGIFYADQKTHVPIDRIMKSLESILGDGQLIEEELFIRNEQHRDGINILSSVYPLRDPNQQVTGWVNVIRDTTKDKTAAAELTQMMTELQEQAQLMETVFNSVSDGVVVTNEQGEFLLVNPSATQITGMAATDTPPDEWSERYGTFYPDKVTRVPTEELPLVQAMQGQITDGIDLFLCNHENPEGVFINVSGRPLQGEHDNVRGGVIVFRDVTEIKNTEARLEQTVEELRDQTRLMDIVFNSISDGVFVMDEKGQFIRANPAVDQMTGPPVADIELNRASEQYGAYHPTEESLLPVDTLPIVQAVNGIATDNVEMRIKDSELPEDLYLSVSGRPLIDEEGILRGGVAVARDITALKRTENQLRESVIQLENQTQLMETVFNSISDGVVVANNEGEYFMFNAAAKRMTGRNMQPTQMKDLVEQVGFFLPDQKTPFPDDQLPIARVLRGEVVENVEMFMHNPSTMQAGIHLSVSAGPLYDAQGVLIGGVSVSRDVTALKRTENQLRELIGQLEHQTQLMESIFNSISDGVVVADENGQFTMFNPSAERIIGMGAVEGDPDDWSDQYGLFFNDRVTPFPPEELPLALALNGQAVDDIELFVRNQSLPDGAYISVNARPLQSETGISGGVAVFRDVTERVLAEEALAQAFAQGRLEIVETILHNIGNAINSVTVGINTLHQNVADNRLVNRFSGLANMVQAHQSDWGNYIKNDPKGQQVLPFMIALAADFTEQNKQLEETLGRVRERVTHIVDIIRTQKASHQTDSMTRKNVELRKAILNAVKLQQDSIDKRGIYVEVDCENAPEDIWIQESQFHQMLVNLFKNSIEAIDELVQSGGLNETPRIGIKAYTSGDFLHLDVTDNGIGITSTNAKLIFTAGYTTKESGTGLGLHSSANFVIAAGGKIQPLSEGIGKGTTMRITLRSASIASR